MLLKGRSESDELLILRYLNNRTELSNKEKNSYLNLERGYEGEVKFDSLIDNLLGERYVINDLLFEVNNSYFQIDSLIISQGLIHLIDIKNYTGDWYLESDKLYKASTHREYKNPVDQLKRCTTLFQQLLHNHKLNYLVDAFVIFINPEFTLYQLPLEQPIILPTQLKRFVNGLNSTPSKLNDGHKQLAQTLISLHQPKNPFNAIPQYNYEQLQKGIYCKSCKSFGISLKNRVFVCRKCGTHEKIEQAIKRNIEEFKLLFPERKVTTQGIFNWCKADLNKRTISRVLNKHYTAYGKTRSIYYK